MSARGPRGHAVDLVETKCSVTTSRRLCHACTSTKRNVNLPVRYSRIDHCVTVFEGPPHPQGTSKTLERVRGLHRALDTTSVRHPPHCPLTGAAAALQSAAPLTLHRLASKPITSAVNGQICPSWLRSRSAYTERLSGALKSLALLGRCTRKPAHWTWRTLSKATMRT